MKKLANLITRRAFLGQSCGTMSSISLLSTLLNLRMIGTASAVTPPAAGDYRALVCFFFPGGQDTFNTLIPRGASAASPVYQEYANTRGSVLRQEWIDLLPIDPIGESAGAYGLNPEFGEIQTLFQNGDLAFMANVGTLVEPIANKTELTSGLFETPLGLYSHADQIKHWQTSVPDSRDSIGWAGRCADVLDALNDPSDVSMSISLSGTNVWQAGNDVFEFAVTPSGAVERVGYTGTTGPAAVRGAAVDSLLELEYTNLFEEAFAQKHRKTLSAGVEFNAAVAGAPAFTTTVPTHANGDTQDLINGFAPQFEMVAKTIAVHQALGIKRHTFFISMGGWDHHKNMLTQSEVMLPAVSKCMGYFWDLLGELETAGTVNRNQVTTFTASDFGRTLNSNSAGSDHGWGGNQMIMGGDVIGKKIYGQFPSLALDAPRDTGRGRQIPSTSCDEFFAELALWMGVSTADLDQVFPNITNFYTPSPSTPPVGFMV